MIAKFPELAKFKPPEEWLSHALERMQAQEEEAKLKREARREKRIAAENDKSWTEGMAAATLQDNVETGKVALVEEKGGESKGEEKKE